MHISVNNKLLHQLPSFSNQFFSNPRHGRRATRVRIFRRLGPEIRQAGRHVRSHGGERGGGIISRASASRHIRVTRSASSEWAFVGSGRPDPSDDGGHRREHSEDLEREREHTSPRRESDGIPSFLVVVQLVKVLDNTVMPHAPSRAGPRCAHVTHARTRGRRCIKERCDNATRRRGSRSIYLSV